jgi:hypothetical protein
MASNAEKLYQELHDKLKKHVKRFEQHERDDIMKFDNLITAQESNTKAINELTISITTLVTNTGDVVQLHKDFQGAARIGKGVQGFMLWLLKWGAIGAGIVTWITWLIDYFKS